MLVNDPFQLNQETSGTGYVRGCRVGSPAELGLSHEPLPLGVAVQQVRLQQG